ncbi:unnamed protein product [Strongylus vulgaris]|uniref:BPTI/Kunitz inhibitor domain-containing protein n=1 Tax=Strongylus vulgaris TaxID=40348 RepID=A0A3P7J0N6_STRVU|nr:unnamed protein product [Strongylus vulgaris]
MFRQPLIRKIPAKFEALPPCNLPVDMGRTYCNNNPSIRYFFDAETVECFPFKYSGCGGNGNNFKTSRDCYDKCEPQGFLKCPANSPPVTTCNETMICPKGTRCTLGFAFGLCCDSEIDRQVESDYHPNCGQRKVVNTYLPGFPDFPVRYASS